MAHTPEHGLGRLHIPDERDANFPMSAPEPTRTFRNWMVPGGISDQGRTSQCVSYACEALLRALPVVNAHRKDLAIDKAELYFEAQKVDQWPGENYDGTSVRAGFKVLTQRGFIGRYTWAWDSGAIARHVLEVGPVVVGTVWTRDMFRPDSHGYIWPTGSAVGGHAYLITACNMRRKNPDKTEGAFRLQNSWGKDWGQGGRAWLTLGSMDKLIADHGEACAPDELRRR